MKPVFRDALSPRPGLWLESVGIGLVYLPYPEACPACFSGFCYNSVKEWFSVKLFSRCWSGVGRKGMHI